MKVYVRLYATLGRPLIERGATFPLAVELPDGSTLADLMACLQVPQDEVKLLFVNGRARKPDYRLSADDRVGLFPPVGGG